MCVRTIARCIFLIFNVLLLFVGLFCMIFGAIFVKYPQVLIFITNLSLIEYANEKEVNIYAQIVAAFGPQLESFYLKIAYFLFFFGSALGIVAAIGILGYCIKIFVIIYEIIAFIFGIVCLILAIVLHAMKGKAKEHMTKYLMKFFTENVDLSKIDNPGNGGVLWTVTETLLKCCGVDSYQDYEQTIGFSSQSKKISPSCCFNKNDSVCWTTPLKNNSYIGQGCKDAIWSQFEAEQIRLTILTALIGIGFIFLGLYTECLVRRNLRF